MFKINDVQSKLIQHIKENSSDYTSQELDLISNYFEPLTISKKDFFLEQGSTCVQAGFVVKGCLRNFVLSSEGKEVNTQFSFENWWIGDIWSFFNNMPSKINCQALEDCTILSISSEKYLKLLEKSPLFQLYNSKLRSTAHISAVLRSSDLSESAKLRHEKLLKQFPEIEKRVSQKHIASYLQITPEFLSRIR